MCLHLVCWSFGELKFEKSSGMASSVVPTGGLVEDSHHSGAIRL